MMNFPSNNSNSNDYHSGGGVFVDQCYKEEIYLAKDWIQTIYLVGSNLFLLLPIIRAYRFSQYTRTFLYFVAMVFSGFYHLCKVSPEVGHLCLFGLCQLRTLDYTFSFSIFFSSVLYLIPFGGKNIIIKSDKKEESVDVEVGEHNHEDNISHVTSRLETKNNFYPNLSYLEDWFLYSIVLITCLLVGPVNGNKSLTYLQIGVILGVLLLMAFLSWWIHYLKTGELPLFDAKDMILSAVFASVGIGLFISEGFLSAPTYWLTHTFWHVTAAIAQLFLLESRNYVHSGWNSLFPLPNSWKISSAEQKRKYFNLQNTITSWYHIKKKQRKDKKYKRAQTNAFSSSSSSSSYLVKL
jgi:hypothetical protein